MRTNTPTRREYWARTIWTKQEGRRIIVGFRAQQVTSRGQHRWVAPLRDDQATADADARAAALAAAGVAT